MISCQEQSEEDEERHLPALAEVRVPSLLDLEIDAIGRTTGNISPCFPVTLHASSI